MGKWGGRVWALSPQTNLINQAWCFLVVNSSAWPSPEGDAAAASICKIGWDTSNNLRLPQLFYKKAPNPSHVICLRGGNYSLQVVCLSMNDQIGIAILLEVADWQLVIFSEFSAFIYIHTITTASSYNQYYMSLFKWFTVVLHLLDAAFNEESDLSSLCTNKLCAN